MNNMLYWYRTFIINNLHQFGHKFIYGKNTHRAFKGKKLDLPVSLKAISTKKNNKALQNLEDEARIKEWLINLEFFILSGKYFFGVMYI